MSAPLGRAVLSIQSHVAFGHVGNAAAVFPLQRMGLEVWPVHTCQLSNHTGYPGFRGTFFPPAEVAAVIAGLGERDLWPSCAAVLSGYLGRAEMGEVVLDAVAAAKGAGQGALYLCDPVMGDDLPQGGGGRVYAAAGVPDLMRARLMPAADVLTPNRFELELLSGRPVGDVLQALAAARALLAPPGGAGPWLVVVTSLPCGPGEVACLAVTRDAAWRIATPLVGFAVAPNGAGDALAALLLGHLLSGREPAKALQQAVGGLYAVLETTARLGRRELALEAAQAHFTITEQRFPIERLG